MIACREDEHNWWMDVVLASHESDAQKLANSRMPEEIEDELDGENDYINV